MKESIHPKYEEATVTCGCGNKFTTRSTRKNITVEICSACHPLFTGKMKFLDTTGRVEKFQKKYNWANRKKAGAEAAPAAEAAETAKDAGRHARRKGKPGGRGHALRAAFPFRLFSCRRPPLSPDP